MKNKWLLWKALSPTEQSTNELHYQMLMFMSMHPPPSNQIISDRCVCSINASLKNMQLYLTVQLYQADRDNPPILCSVISWKALRIISYSEITVFFLFHVDDMNQWPKWKLLKLCAKPIHSAQTLISLRWSLTFQLLVWHWLQLFAVKKIFLSPSTHLDSRFSSSHSLKCVS